jgi:hypothetical protein
MSIVIVPTLYGPGWLKSTGSGARVVGEAAVVGLSFFAQAVEIASSAIASAHRPR